MTRVKYTNHIADVAKCEVSNKDTLIVSATNADETYEIQVNRIFTILPSVGDNVKILKAISAEDSLISVIVPIEIKIKNARTQLCIDYDQVIKALSLNLKDTKSWWQVLFNNHTQKEQFILDIEKAKTSFLKTYHKNKLH